MKKISLILCLFLFTSSLGFTRTADASTTISNSASDILNDEFGYIMEEIDHEWTDVSDGTRIVDFPIMLVGAQVDIPFEFPFYADKYDSFVVSWNGTLSLGHNHIYGSGWTFPSPNSINSFIAPFRGIQPELILSDTSRIHHKVVGNAPNRSVIVQWSDMSSNRGNGPYTFQAELREDGTILLHHHSMASDSVKAIVGIEDQDGLVGVAKLYSSDSPPSDKTYRIRRPAPRARIDVMTPYTRSLFSPAGIAGYADIVVRNTGETGSDTFEIFTNTLTPPIWPYHLQDQDGNVLADTDADGSPDTGAVPEGGTITVSMVMTAPIGTPIGFAAETSVEIRSSLDETVTRSVPIYTSVPPRFVMMWNDFWDQRVHRSADNAFGSKKEASDPKNVRPGAGIADMGDGRYVFFDRQVRFERRTNGYRTHTALHRFIVDNGGNAVSPRSQLVSTEDNPSSYLIDGDPITARTSNGNLGIFWERAFLTDNKWFYETYFGILGSDGFLIGTPSLVDSYDETGVYEASIKLFAIDDRFIAVWHPMSETTRWSPIPRYKIYDANGNLVQETRTFSGMNTPGTQVQAITSTGGDDAEIAVLVKKTYDFPNGLLLQRMKLTGEAVGNPLRISPTWGDPDYDGDVLYAGMVRTGDGRYVAVWRQGLGLSLLYRTIRYAILDSDFNILTSATKIPQSNHIGASENAPKIIAAGDQQVFVVWQDADALMISSAFIRTDGRAEYAGPLAIARRTNGYRNINFPNNSLTTFSGSVPAIPDPAIETSPDVSKARPGGLLQIPIDVRNQGGSIAENTTLSITLPPGVTYAGDDTGIRPRTQTRSNSQTLSWTLSPTRYLDTKTILLKVLLPDVAYGTRYSITGTLSTPMADASTTNNTVTATVQIAHFTYGPLVRRSE